MASETEIERLVVRLMGDSTHFRDTINKAVQDAINATRKMERGTARSEAFINRVRARSQRQQYSDGDRTRRERERAEAAVVAAAKKAEADLERIRARSLRTQYQQGDRARRQREADDIRAAIAAEARRERLRANSLRVQYQQGERARREREAAEAGARIPPRFLVPPPIRVTPPPIQQSFLQAQRAQEMHNRAVQEGYNLFMSVRTPLEQYNMAIARSNQLLQQGGLTQRQHAEYVQRTTQAYRESVTTIADYSSELRNAGLVIAGIAAGFTAAFSALLVNSVRSAGEFTQMRIAFETMLGSAGEAKRTINDIIEFAIKTPFTLHQVESATRTMVTFGETGDQLMDTLNFLGNAASATSTDFGLVALVFNQIRGVGHLLMQDFRQLAIRGILSMADLAKFYGVTTTKAQQMMTAQQISFEDVRAVLRGLSEEGGRFAGMNEKLAEEMMGLWSNLSDSVSILYRQIGQQLEPTVNKLLKTLLNLTNVMRGASDTTLTLLSSVLVLGAGFGGLTMAVGTGIFVFGQLTITAKALKEAYDALNASGAVTRIMSVSARAGLIALAVALTTIVSVAIYNANSDIKAFNASMEESIKLADKLASREAKGQSAFMSGLSGMSTKDRKKAIQDEIEATKTQIDGFKFQMGLVKKHTESLQTNWKDHGVLGQFIVNSKELELQAELMRQYGISMDQAKAHLQALNLEQQRAADKPSEAMEDALKTLEKWRSEIRTFGMTAREAEIAELAIKDVGAATLNLLLIEDRRQTALEKQQKITEYIREYNDEAVKSANILGLTAVQAKVLEAALMGANAAQQEMVRSIALFDEGQKLMEKYRPPLEVYRRQLAIINELNNAGAITQEVFDAALRDAEKALIDANLDKHITFHISGMDAVRKGTQEYYDILNAVEKRRATAELLNEANQIPNPPVDSSAAPGTPEAYAREAAEAAKQNEASNKQRNSLLGRIAAATEANNKKPTITLTALGLV